VVTSFADLKNDFVFRRVFGKHPEILRRLLNDLLERQGERMIESIEYLPSEQLPLAEGAKLSILDVRCRDRIDRPRASESLPSHPRPQPSTAAVLANTRVVGADALPQRSRLGAP